MNAIKILPVLVLTFCQYVYSAEREPMNFAMFTDRGYVIPTAVAIDSVTRNTSGAKNLFVFTVDVPPTDMERLRSLGDAATTVRVFDLRATQFSAMVGRATCNDGNYIQRSGYTNVDLVYLKLLLPDLLEAAGLILKDILWLDGDLIVKGDLGELFADCREQRQSIVTAFRSCDSRRPFDHFAEGGSVTRERDFQASGGVVFFALELLRQTNVSLVDVPDIGTDENAYEDLLLSERGSWDQIYFFAMRYNFHPKHLTTLAQFLSDTRGLPVVIWHWDFQRKPWMLIPQRETPDILWWIELIALKTRYPIWREQALRLFQEAFVDRWRDEQRSDWLKIDSISALYNDYKTQDRPKVHPFHQACAERDQRWQEQIAAMLPTMADRYERWEIALADDPINSI